MAIQITNKEKQLQTNVTIWFLMLFKNTKLNFLLFINFFNVITYTRVFSYE